MLRVARGIAERFESPGLESGLGFVRKALKLLKCSLSAGGGHAESGWGGQLLCPVSAALAIIFRMDSISTSYLQGSQASVNTPSVGKTRNVFPARRRWPC